MTHNILTQGLCKKAYVNDARKVLDEMIEEWDQACYGPLQLGVQWEGVLALEW